MEKKEKPYLATGCELLDLMTGGAKNVFGVRSGTVLNIVGDSSTGKTFIVTEMIVANAIKYGKKFKWCYDDAENAYSFDSRSMYGVDFDVVTPEMPHSETVQDCFYNITKFIDTIEDDEFGIYVLDSLDAVSSSEIQKLEDARIKAMDNDKDFDQGSYKMEKAKFLSSEFFPTIVNKLARKNILLVIISQIRDKIDPMSFEKYTRAGGKALQFYCSMVIWMASLKKITKNEIPIGGVTLAKMTKGKVARPFRTCTYSFYFDYGIDNIGSMIDYLYDLRTKTGELSSALAKNIAWEPDETKLKVESNTIRKFLQEEGRYQDALSTCNNGRFDLGTVLEFITKDADLNAKYGEKFEKVMERDALIAYIENNGLEEELTRRVVAKWEATEDAISTKRVKKYATQPQCVEGTTEG